jgi:hypothetical protein
MMTDLTKIQRPFCFIGQEKREALTKHHGAGGQIEMLYPGGEWSVVRPPSWIPGYIYRAKPQPEPTKPDAPWEVLPKWAACIATDEDRSVFCYSAKPDPDLDMWCAKGGKCLEVTDLKGVTPGTCRWRDSLVERPQ